MHVKGRFIQSELGIIAGFPRFSCHSAHTTKTGTSASPILKIIIFGASLSFDVFAVKVLVLDKYLFTDVRWQWLTQIHRKVWPMINSQWRLLSSQFQRAVAATHFLLSPAHRQANSILPVLQTVSHIPYPNGSHTSIQWSLQKKTTEYHANGITDGLAFT